MARRVLLVASVGGHLQELHKLSGSLVTAGDEVTWVTSDSPQSRSLLASSASVVSFRRMGPRSYWGLIRSILPAVRLLRSQRPDVVISTGACVALAFLPLAWLVGAKAVFIESAARTRGPSVTGRLLSWMPWVQLRTQHAEWSDRRWQYFGSVFDHWRAAPTSLSDREICRVFVTTGTQHGYPYLSLIDAVQRVVPEGVEVRYQVGADFPLERRPAGALEMLSQEQFDEWIDWADVVVAHAGVGSAMALLSAGRVPVLCPRRAGRNEHVDDHQTFIAEELSRRGLAVATDVAELTWQHMVSAAGAGVRTVDSAADDMAAAAAEASAAPDTAPLEADRLDAVQPEPPTGTVTDAHASVA